MECSVLISKIFVSNISLCHCCDKFPPPPLPATPLASSYTLCKICSWFYRFGSFKFTFVHLLITACDTEFWCAATTCQGTAVDTALTPICMGLTHVQTTFTACFSVTCIARDSGYLSISIFRHAKQSTNHSPPAWPFELVTYFHRSHMKQTPVCIDRLWWAHFKQHAERRYRKWMSKDSRYARHIENGYKKVRLS